MRDFVSVLSLRTKLKITFFNISGTVKSLRESRVPTVKIKWSSLVFRINEESFRQSRFDFTTLQWENHPN